MKFIALILFSLYLPGSLLADTHPKSITIGFNSGASGADFKSKALSLAKIIQEQIKKPIKVYISPDYSSLILAMKQKKIDFAFFTAMTYVMAEKETKIKVLLKSVWKSPYYYSAIVTHPKSNLKSLKDLKSKSFAYVDKKSTSGYLLPKQALNEAGIKDKDIRTIFSGNHKESIKILYDRKVAAVGVFSDDAQAISGAWNALFTKNNPHPVKVLWVSKSIPTDPFCVRDDFYTKYPQLTHDIMFQLLEMEMNPKTQGKLKEYLGISRMVTATSSQYDPIRKLLQ